MSTLLADLRAAVAVWRRRPELVVVEVAILVIGLAVATVVPDLDPEADLARADEIRILVVGTLVTIGVAIPQLAWIGAQRVVYAEAWAQPDSVGLGGTALVRTAGRQLGRFLVLGLLGAVVLFPILALSASESLTTTGGVLSMLVLIAVDVALTFVTPALALSTSSVRVALAVGWRLLRGNWEAAEWHAMLPPVVLGMHTYLDLPDRIESTITLALALLLVATRGAVVALYLRLPHDAVLAEVTEGIAGRPD